ncbi:hypothetical protein TIFTF001_016407 [Ficus carica]|uniref:Uncharacterized protein n=1 Tax=Ficus carica TaxID=3494 RepID=A0AA88A7I2_FICCA|nr:hypothetical protein TIFTF001_016407 [Ficus carica]
MSPDLLDIVTVSPVWHPQTTMRERDYAATRHEIATITPSHFPEHSLTENKTSWRRKLRGRQGLATVRFKREDRVRNRRGDRETGRRESVGLRKKEERKYQI